MQRSLDKKNTAAVIHTFSLHHPSTGVRGFFSSNGSITNLIAINQSKLSSCATCWGQMCFMRFTLHSEDTRLCKGGKSLKFCEMKHPIEFLWIFVPQCLVHWDCMKGAYRIKKASMEKNPQNIASPNHLILQERIAIILHSILLLIMYCAILLDNFHWIGSFFFKFSSQY